MPKVILTVLLIINSLYFFLLTPVAEALSCPVANPAQDVILVTSPPSIKQPIDVAITLNTDTLPQNYEYKLLISSNDLVGADDAFSDWIGYSQIYDTGSIPIDPNKRNFRIFQFSTTTQASKTGRHIIKLVARPTEGQGRDQRDEDVCPNLGSIDLIDQKLIKTDCVVSLNPGKVQWGQPFQVNISFKNPQPDYNHTFYILKKPLSSIPESDKIGSAKDILSPVINGPPPVFRLQIKPTSDNPLVKIPYSNDGQMHDGQVYPRLNLGEGINNGNNYSAAVVISQTESVYFCNKFEFEVTNKDTSNEPSLIVGPKPAPGSPDSLKKVATRSAQPCIPGQNCTQAAGEFCNKEAREIRTAIGCVPTEPTAFLQTILKFAVGIGGGVAFLMMIAGAFEMITSQGNPEPLKAGQERMTNAVIGLLFIIFSVLLLQIIGVDILGIPDFVAPKQ